MGINKDSVRSHQKFKAKLNLPFTLLSDPEAKVCKDYGVLKEKKLYGKSFVGIERSTFIIDDRGTVVEAYRGVKVKGHVEAVIDRLDELRR